jgi:Heterokaryon incompatibility protein (HET)
VRETEAAGIRGVQIDIFLLARSPIRTMNPYIYEPLDEDKSEIRLLTLLGGNVSDDIFVLLRTTQLTEEIVPVYEALSYTWGAVDDRVAINVDSGTVCSLEITRNLATALRYLRYQKRDRSMWIDAVCVDQKNPKERGHQVERMADVFKLAERVVVWTGPEADDSAYALQLLTDLDSNIEVDWPTHTMRVSSTGSPEPHWADPSEILPYDERELSALAALLDRSWFERLWVRQEIWLAKSAILMCGQDVILWQAFRKAIFGLETKKIRNSYHLDPEKGGFRNRMEMAYRLVEDKSIESFDYHLHEARVCKCVEPRDRVYALLSMLHRSERRLDIKPDYTKTKAQVYQEVVLSKLEKLYSATILTRCEMQEGLDLELPSWVPDWSKISLAIPLKGGGATGSSLADSRYLDHGVLAITGVLSASIDTIEKFVFVDASYKHFVHIIRRLAPPGIHKEQYVAGGSSLEAYCRTLCNNKFGNEFVPALADWPSFEACQHLLRSYLELSEVDKAELIHERTLRRYACGVWDTCEGRAMFTTKEGYSGLAPRAARQGDKICVILGCHSPLCLRPSTLNRFQVVGECYVHGLMDKEALYGKLPTQYRTIRLLDESRGFYVPAYQDASSGRIRRSDPRLESLCEIVNNTKTIEADVEQDELEDEFVTATILRKVWCSSQDFRANLICIHSSNMAFYSYQQLLLHSQKVLGMVRLDF